MSQLSTGASDDERRGPLVVRPARAAELLSTSRVRVYELINAGELKSFRDGGARKITVDSIHDYIKRKIADGQKAAA